MTRRLPTPRVRRAARALALACSLVAACGGGGDKSTATRHASTLNAENGGTVVIASAAEPKALVPTVATSGAAAAIVAQLFDRMAEVGDSLNTVGDVGFKPRLARKWMWAPDSLSIAFSIDPNARWHDDTPVTAADVKFSFDLYTDPATNFANAAALANVDSISTPDSLTAIAWFKRRTPQQFFDLTYPLYVLPRHLLAKVPHDRLAASPFAKEPIGSGRFRLESWTPGERIELRADKDNYRGRARLDRVVWQFAPDFGAATISLINGDADFFDQMRPEYLGQLAANRSLVLVPYQGLDYGFLQFNLQASDGSGRPHPLFSDPALRRALSMAVDRERVVASAFDSLAYVAVGPVARALLPEWKRLRQIPFNPAVARQTLDSLGWRVGADGIRARGGVPLAFTLLVPTGSATRQRMVTLIQEQLRTVGASVTVESLDLNALVDRQRRRTFDAAIGGWRSDPSQGTVLQTWGTLGARPNGYNYSGYASATFDAQVDSAMSALAPAKSRELWLHAYQTIVDDAPAIWLVEPRPIAGAHRRLHLTGLRADGWWAALDEWYIPSRERTTRDGIGFR